MANASPSFGKDLKFTIDTAGTTSGSTEVDISRHIMGIDGLPGEREKADITCGGGAVAHEFITGLKAADVSLLCLLDQSTGQSAFSAWTTFANATTGDTHSRSFHYWPVGETTGYPLISGELRFKSINLGAKPLEALTFTVNMVLDSSLAIGTA